LKKAQLKRSKPMVQTKEVSLQSANEDDDESDGWRWMAMAGGMNGGFLGLVERTPAKK
jgi:hypothetical protein